jgi:hypothetical protein
VAFLSRKSHFPTGYELSTGIGEPLKYTRKRIVLRREWMSLPVSAANRNGQWTDLLGSLFMQRRTGEAIRALKAETASEVISEAI